MNAAKLVFIHLADDIPCVQLDAVEEFKGVISAVNGLDYKVVLVFLHVAGVIIEIKSDAHGTADFADTSRAFHIKLNGGSRVHGLPDFAAVLRQGHVLLLVNSLQLGVEAADHGVLKPVMNKGVRMSSGDVVGFLNADDYYQDNGVLETVPSLFLTNPSKVSGVLSIKKRITL